jgi:hypothetical protein
MQSEQQIISQKKEVCDHPLLSSVEWVANLNWLTSAGIYRVFFRRRGPPATKGRNVPTNLVPVLRPNNSGNPAVKSFEKLEISNKISKIRLDG